MEELTIYSTVVGELPRLVDKQQPMCFIPYSEVLELKNKLMEIFSDNTHTVYQNRMYAQFLLRKVGL